MRYATRIAAAVADWWGRQVAPRTLTERQTDLPQLAPLQRTWGGNPVRGLTPRTLADLLDGAVTGDLRQQAELYLAMEDADPHLLAEMSKRRRAILSIPWSIEPPPNAKPSERKAAAAIAELLTGIANLEDVLLDCMDAVGHGYACLEITWSTARAGARVPLAIEHRPPDWFRLDRATRTELRLLDNSGEGAPLWPMGWITHVHRARSGYLWRAGLYRALCWPWIMRQFSLRDMAEWLEIYGLPTRLGYYPPGAPGQDKAVLLRAVRDLGRHASGIMPEGMRIDLLAAAQGQADPFLAMVQYCDAVMSKAILGGTLSSTPGATGLGSGVADLQGEVKRDLLLSDARQVQGTLSRDLLYPLFALNHQGTDPARAPRWVFDTREPADLGAFADSLQKLVQAGAGAMIPLTWVREQSGIPEPLEGEATLGAAPVAPETPPAAVAPAAALAAASVPPATLPADYSEAHTQALASAAEPALQALLVPIRAEIDAVLTEGGDLAALGERLLRLYPRLPAGDLVAVLSEALTAADLAGRYDLERGE